MVHATAADIERVAAIVDLLGMTSRRVNLLVRSFEMPEDKTPGGWSLCSAAFSQQSTFSEPRNSRGPEIEISQHLFTALVPDAQARAVTGTLKSMGLREIDQQLFETKAGRQTQIPFTNHWFPTLWGVRPGLGFDIIPNVASDGSSIDMTVIPSLIEISDSNENGSHLQYFDSVPATPQSVPFPNRVVQGAFVSKGHESHWGGGAVVAQPILPWTVRIYQSTTNVTVSPTQTLVFGISLTVPSPTRKAEDIPRLADGTVIKGILTDRFLIRRNFLFLITPGAE